MAQVTVELRNLLKTSNFELFDFDYPFDDDQFKEELEQMVIDYFYFYEINGTPDYFKHRFRTLVQRIMPYYNKLYNTTLLDYDPLVNYKMEEALEELSKTTSTQDSQMESSGQSDGQTEGSGQTSDYPQQPIANGNYLAGADETQSTTSNTDSGTSTTNTTGDTQTDNTYDKTIEGITGVSYQELIASERSSILRITDMIIEELKPCFILVY